MAKLIIRKELLESSVSFENNGSSYSVNLKDATQAQLAILKAKEIDVFEKDEVKK